MDENLKEIDHLARQLEQKAEQAKVNYDALLRRPRVNWIVDDGDAQIKLESARQQAQAALSELLLFKRSLSLETKVQLLHENGG